MANQTNSEHLHEEGVLNQDDMTDEQRKAIDSLSKEEVDQLKKMHKNIAKNSGQPVGFII